MIKVYVAGAYSDDNVLGVLKNIGRGETIAAELFRLGFAPFTPWHDKSFVIENWDDDFTVEQFYNYSMEWLKASDAVLIVPNIKGLKNWEDSKGTLAEIEVAKENNIPVFYTIKNLIVHRAMRDPNKLKENINAEPKVGKKFFKWDIYNKGNQGAQSV